MVSDCVADLVVRRMRCEEDLVPYTAAQLLDMGRDELRMVRAQLFLQHGRFLAKEALCDVFMEFITRLTIVQDLRDWSKLAEPGIAGHMMSVEWATEETVEQARELDRRSMETHSEIAVEFEARGGR